MKGKTSHPVKQPVRYFTCVYTGEGRREGGQFEGRRLGKGAGQ